MMRLIKCAFFTNYALSSDFILACMVPLTCAVYGQDSFVDFESRIAVAYGSKGCGMVDVTASHELRLSENSTMIRRSLSTVGLN